MLQGSFPAHRESCKGLAFPQTGKIAALASATILFFLCFIALPASGQVSVLTQHADNARDGVYSNETQLTPTSVIHKLFTMSLDDPVDGQALVLGGLSVSGYPTNIVYAVTSPPEGTGASSAWAFNADTGAKLWQLSFGTSAAFSTATPVLDPNFGPHGALFVVTKDSSTNTNKLHAIDALAGTELAGSPVTISGTVNGDSFTSSQHNDRSALLDINGTIYTSFCHMTDSGTYHGWVIGYEYANGSGFAANGIWCSTCQGANEGGIWQGGDGLIYDGTSIFVETGNGTSVTGGNYAQSIVQLSPSALGTVESYLQPPGTGAGGDSDVNGGGMVLMPGTGGKIFLGPTKYGDLYLIDSTKLTGGTPIDTYSTNGAIGHSPIAWNSGSAQYAYVWPASSAIQQYCYSSSSGSFTGTGACQQSSFTSGGTLAISSTPSATNAILWAYGNGELHAMNPANVSAADYWNSNESSGDSTGSGPGGFQYIAVANGKVYVPSGNNLLAYGTPSTMCTAAPSAPGNLTATATSTSNINLNWSASTVGSGCGLTYSVFQSTTSGFTPSSSNQIATGLTSLSYSSGGLAASTTYYYLVEGVDSVGASTPSNQASAMTQSGVIGTQLIAIDSGSTTAVSPFVADEDFTGGATIDHANTINTSEVTDPAPAAVYQTGRDGNFSYTIGGFTPGTDYLVRLHFCETFFSSAGSRTFNVSINGTQVLTDFDIFAAAGGQNIANIQAFTEPANSSGQFVIVFTSVVNNSLVSGIEVDTGTGSSCTAAPSVPSGLGATAISSSQINLSWTASTAGSGCSITYNVYSSTTSGFTPSTSNQIATGVTGTTYSNTGLAASTTYYYLVEAVDSFGSSTQSNQASATTSASSGSCTSICIDSGSTTAVSPFVADEDFTGGTTINHANTIDTSHVTNPAPAAVYQTARVANFTYTIGGFTANSSHNVRLHFCETYFSTAGSRTFNVSINGTQVLSAFDIYAAAGGKNIANIQQFTENANSSGQYVIVFTEVVNQSLISGIEID